MPLVKIDCTQITDWHTFSDVFAAAFGFPGYYGRNMNAWIDCMTYLDDPDAGIERVVDRPRRELMTVDDGIRRAIVKKPKLEAIRAASKAAGNHSLQEEAIRLVATGVTSIEEISRVLKE